MSVGAGANIIGAVHVGNNVKIGAGAVVIRDIPNNCIAVGVPARIITVSYTHLDVYKRQGMDCPII